MSALEALLAHLPQALAWLTTGGGGVIIWNAYRKWRDGRAQEQKEIEQAKLKEKMYGRIFWEIEARNRRRMQEYASELRALLFAHRVPPDEIPPYPDLEKVQEIYDE